MERKKIFMRRKEKMTRTDKAFRICFFGFLVFYLIYLFFLGTQKINFHIDEYFTYALSNKEGAPMPVWPIWEDGKTYEGLTYFEQNMMPEGTERFNYAMVWENQANDVHPPLYYVLFHTVCSVFSETFSKWQGLSINFVLMIVINILVYGIAKKMFKEKWIALIAMIVNAMTLLTLNMAMFLRMYGLMTMFILCIVLLFLTYARKEKDWKFYLGTLLFSVGGALTQYYFLIFLFFICLVFGFMLLYQKKWKDVSIFVGSLAGAGAVSIFIFPSMLVQIFGGSDRGQEAFQNIQTLPNMFARLKDYYNIINSEVFGGYMPLFIILACVMLILVITKQWVKCENVQDLCIVLFPTIAYCVIVALISPYMQDRYIMGTGPLWILSSIWLLYYFFIPLFKSENIKKTNIIIGCIACFVVVSGLNNVSWEPTYTYQYMREKYEMIEEYKECSVVYVYDYSWTFNDNIVELEKYKDYTFIKPENLGEYMETRDDDRIIVYNESPLENEDLCSIILQSNYKLTKYTTLFKNSAESILYFE